MDKNLPPAYEVASVDAVSSSNNNDHDRIPLLSHQSPRYVYVPVDQSQLPNGFTITVTPAGSTQQPPSYCNQLPLPRPPITSPYTSTAGFSRRNPPSCRSSIFSCRFFVVLLVVFAVAVFFLFPLFPTFFVENIKLKDGPASFRLSLSPPTLSIDLTAAVVGYNPNYLYDLPIEITALAFYESVDPPAFVGSGHSRDVAFLQSRRNTTFPFDFTVSRSIDPSLFGLIDSISKECRHKGKISLKLDLLFELDTLIPRKLGVLHSQYVDVSCN